MAIDREEAYRRYQEGLELARMVQPGLDENGLDSFALAYTAARLGVDACFVFDETGLPLMHHGRTAVRFPIGPKGKFPAAA